MVAHRPGTIPYWLCSTVSSVVRRQIVGLALARAPSTGTSQSVPDCWARFVPSAVSTRMEVYPRSCTVQDSISSGGPFFSSCFLLYSCWHSCVTSSVGSPPAVLLMPAPFQEVLPSSTCSRVTCLAGSSLFLLSSRRHGLPCSLGPVCFSQTEGTVSRLIWTEK